MIDRMIDRMRADWNQWKLEFRMWLCGAFVKNERELKALKNLVHIARERTWLADEPRSREYSTVFSDVMTDEERSTINESARVVEQILRRETDISEKANLH